MGWNVLVHLSVCQCLGFLFDDETGEVWVGDLRLEIHAHM